MPKPVCLPCHRFMRPHRTGFYFTEGMPKTNEAPPGLEAPDQWEPYKIWAGDIYKCQGCGAEVITGFGLRPIERYEERFDKLRKSLGADKYQVNDC